MTIREIQDLLEDEDLQMLLESTGPKPVFATPVVDPVADDPSTGQSVPEKL